MLSLDDVLFDPSSRCVFRGEEEFKLSPKAASVLLALAETPGQVWSRDALLERVWPMVHVGEEVLTHAIAELRRALGDNFRNPRYLATVHKSGYRLMTRVRKEEPERQAPAHTGTGAAFGFDAFAAYLAALETLDRGGRQNTLAALALFSSLLKNHPDFAQAHVGKAKALMFLGSVYEPRKSTLEEALTHCAAALRLSPTSASAASQQGYVFAVLGDIDRSLPSFKLAIELRPDLAETHLMLGRVALARGEIASACVMYECAARRNPSDHFTPVTAGILRKSLGETAQARANFAVALQRTEARLAAATADIHTLRQRARCLLELGRAEEGYTLLRTVAAEPDNNHFSVACSFAAFGEIGRALDAFDTGAEQGVRAWSWLPHHPDIAILRGDRRFERLSAHLAA